MKNSGLYVINEYLGRINDRLYALKDFDITSNNGDVQTITNGQKGGTVDSLVEFKNTSWVDENSSVTGPVLLDNVLVENSNISISEYGVTSHLSLVQICKII